MTMQKQNNPFIGFSGTVTGTLLTPSSDINPALSRKVPEKEIKDLVGGFENKAKHMYLDTEGNVTVGIGQLLPDENTARDMPFYQFEGKNNPIRQATQDEIGDAYNTLRNYKKLSNANVDQEDWPRAADESHRKTGNKQRNARMRELLETIPQPAD